MTNHQPIDARPSAWVGAMDRITAAQKLKMDPQHKNRVADPLPELYWATLAEAAVLADLANAPDPVGFIAGAHLTDRHARIEEGRRLHETLFAAVQERRRRPAAPPTPECREQFAHPPFARGHHVRVVRGDFAGRVGYISAIYPDRQPPVVDVGLYPQAWTGAPVQCADFARVPWSDVELIDPGAGHRIDKGDRVRVTMSRRCMDGKFAGRTGTVRDIGVKDGAGWIEVELDHMEGLRYAGRTVITVRADVLEKVAV